MLQQVAYGSDNKIISTLTNGNFSTNDDVKYNKIELELNDNIRYDLGSKLYVSKLDIAAGNADFGGNEMPKNMKLYSSDSINGPWNHVSNLKYDVEQVDNRKSAEVQTIEFPEILTQYLMLTFDSSYGDSSVTVRQAKFIARSGNRINLINNKMGDNCAEVVKLLNELIADKKSVDSSKELLKLMNSKGINVANSFQPLEIQSSEIQKIINNFTDAFDDIKNDLQELITKINTVRSVIPILDNIDNSNNTLLQDSDQDNILKSAINRNINVHTANGYDQTYQRGRKARPVRQQ